MARAATAARAPRAAASRRRRPSDLRRVALWGAPLAVAGGLAVGAVLSGMSPAHGLSTSRSQSLSADALELTGKLGLVVTDIEVTGRTTTDRETILAALDAHYGTPILGVSPARAKQQLETLPWVRSAAIERRLPGTILVRLVERRPVGVWQHDGKQELIDRDGTVIPVTDLSRFAKLPTVVGDDHARRGAAQLFDLLASEPALAARITAAVLVGDRRWNVRLDHLIDVMLPEDDIAGAWSKLAELERTSSILQRDVEAIDLRLPDRLVIRVNDAAAKDAPVAKKPHASGKST
ncbi:MAG TPA: FtsQ-type POTRA domain-containing protein [Stellaceae bacterium]|nr:FtsQ-type POTRA domain-containing protein [Stellaceae bacterium]